MTNKEKFIEVFGLEPSEHFCPLSEKIRCGSCPYSKNGCDEDHKDRFFSMEYKEPSTKNDIRDCKSCVYSKDGKCAGTEECHLCMWENQYIPTTKTNLEAIRQMDLKELAYFLSVIRWDDLNSIHMIPKEDIDYFTEYLNKDGSELIESVKSCMEDWKKYMESEDEDGNNAGND